MRVCRAVLFTGIGVLLIPAARAEEGMWRREQLNSLRPALQKAGLQVPVDRLADLENGPLAAVISLGGCSAAFVSPDGLIATNHHCASAALQVNSVDGNNRIEDGYTARTRQDELWAGAASRVRVTLSETDITAELLAAATSAKSDIDAFRAADALGKAKVAACEARPGVRCSVAKFDGGASYVLVAQLDLRDVRLVHAPPRAVGDYGGDIDNWMWPRHSGDWALFRAYVGPGGRPADHAKENVPFSPRVWLPVNPDGVGRGAFVAVAGYPGRTYRHRTALELRQIALDDYPRLQIFVDAFVAVVHTAQSASADAKVKLSSLEGSLTNYQKYLKGNLDGFRSSRLVEARQADESRFRAWTDASRSRAPYAEALENLDELDTVNHVTQPSADALRWLLRGPALLRTAAALHWLAAEREKPDAERDVGYQDRDVAEIEATISQAMRSFEPTADKAVARFLLGQVAALPPGVRLPAVDSFLLRFASQDDASPALGESTIRQGAIDRAVDWIYGQTRLHEAGYQRSLVEGTRAVLEAEPDHALAFAAAIYADRVADRDRTQALEGATARLRPPYMAAVAAFAGRAIYPDANGTLRITYGRVEAMSPRDGVQYLPQTTLQGIVAKNTGSAPFDAPPKLLKAIAALDAKVASGAGAGPYVDKLLRSVPVNFMTSVDTTGGNSGSPTIDAAGRFVGLLFDGNYEAMDSDWVYDSTRTRSIHCDVRYLLWSLVNVWDGAHLVREMGAK